MPRFFPAAGGGAVDLADLGSGTPDATTFLRGDATWAEPPAAGGGGGDPRTTLVLVDDFVGGEAVSSGGVGDLGWATSNGSGARLPAETGHPGILRRTTGTTSGTYAQIALQQSSANTGGQAVPVADAFDALWIVRPVNVDANTVLRAGLQPSQGGSAQPIRGVYLEKLAADTDWFAVAREANVETRSAALGAVAAAWTAIRVRRIDAGSIGFSLNDGAETVLTSNLPTLALVPFVVVGNTAAADKAIDIDFFSLTISGLSR